MHKLRVNMALLIIVLILLIGIFAVAAVRVGAKAEKRMKDIFDKKNDRF